MTLDSSTLAHALQVATAAALAAGGHIRAETRRPNGPRGSGHHADVDQEAEELIRSALLEAFPSWSYRGEETAPVAGHSGPRWLVDPNDGTAAFLRGHRGSTVSIALIDGDLPVLGVVYAPCAPDDDGDLITWAEGQPLRRNGAVVSRTPLPERLAPDVIVAVSQDADRGKSAANLAIVAPARVRAIPSIAYRLALAAVGDVDAAVSLAAPTDWDVAGGHALLRAVGGDLVSYEGNPLRYSAPLPCSDVFGGSLKLARTLARKDSSPIRARATDVPAFAYLSPRAHEHDAGRLARAQGCLLGQLAGDSLGSLVEFESPAAIRRDYPAGVRDLADGGTWNTLAGQPTDDSELALSLARSLVQRGRFNVVAVTKSYQAWLASRPFDVGSTTRAGLTGHPRMESAANGSLMRVSPLGIFAHAASAERAAEWAGQDSAITHPNPLACASSQVFTASIAFAIREGATPAAVHGFACGLAEQLAAPAEVRAALVAAASAPPEDFMSQQGYVLIALQNAYHQLLHAPSLEEGLINTVGRGGDTDTNGAIAGALLGAVRGRGALPARWVRRILSCRPLKGAAGVERARPWPYWPIDALELAELLLLAGASAPDAL